MTTTAIRPAAPPPVMQSRSWVPDVLRQSATLAWRGVTKTMHSTEALLDVTLQPVIFLLLFVYVFGGAIAGDPGTYLQYALPGGRSCRPSCSPRRAPERDSRTT